MVKQKFVLCLAVVMTAFFILRPEIARAEWWDSAPAKVRAQANEYLAAQVSEMDKLYLQKLQKAFIDMSRLNEASSSYWSAFPSFDEAVDVMLKRFQQASDIAMEYGFGASNTAQEVGNSIADVVGKSLKATGRAVGQVAGEVIPLIGEIANLIEMYNTFMEISDTIKDGVTGMGTQQHYDTERTYFKDNFGNTPLGVLEEAKKEFEMKITPEQVAGLKKFLKEKIKSYDEMMPKLTSLVNEYKDQKSDEEIVREFKAKMDKKLKERWYMVGTFELLRDNIEVAQYRDRIKEKRNWVGVILHKLLPITLQQVKINRAFCSGVLARVEMIPDPQVPKWPDLVVSSVEVTLPLNKKAEDLRIGDEVTVSAQIKNDSGLTSSPTSIKIGAVSDNNAFRPVGENLELPALSAGATHRIEVKAKLPFTSNRFLVRVNEDKRSYEWNYDNDEKYSEAINLNIAPDLTVAFNDLPQRIYAGKAVTISVRIKNIGYSEDLNPVAELLVNNAKVSEQRLGLNHYLKPNEEANLTFKWTPQDKGSYVLRCEVERGLRGKSDFNEKNNHAEARAEVLLPDYAWEIPVYSLMLSSDSPKIGEQLKFYFSVTNKGAKEDAIAKIFVDGELIKTVRLSVAPGENQGVGLGSSEPILWTVRGGTHTFKVVLEAGGQELVTAEKSISVGTLMPGVQGIDVVLDAASYGGVGPNITAKVYNRGSQTAKQLNLDALEYHSYTEKPVAGYSKNLGDIRSHELKVVKLDKELCNNCKMQLIVDKDNKIPETDEKNNTKDFHFGTYHAYEPPRNIRAEASDLIVADVVNLDRPLEVGETRAITIVIGNPNLVEAKNVRVEYEFWNLALNDVTAGHGYRKGAKVIPSVGQEGGASIIVDYKGVYPADYKLTVLVDPQGAIAETDEYNNKLEKYFNVSGEVTSQIYFSGKDADLSIDKDIKVSNKEPTTDLPVTFEVTVHNNCGITVWGADLDMLIDDELEAGQALGDFYANSERTVTFRHTFSKSGDCTVKFMVDAKKAIPEKDENNNAATVKIKVKPGILGTGYKDVAVTNFSLSKTSCLQGEPVTAQASVKNIGQDILRGVLCTIGPSGTKPVYVKVVPILDPGQEIKISATLPALIAGDHTIEARVDGKDIIKETNETNNVMTASLHVEKLTKEKLEQEAKQKVTGAIFEKIGQIQGAIDSWLRGLGKPK
ncbi:MAG: CARDB domain-containing protein [Candidatus Omnitrophota bacterium]